MSEKHSTAASNGACPKDLKAAVALYRISDDKQDSLPTQRGWAQGVTQRDGLTLAGEFEDEGISGADVIRPALAAGRVRQGTLLRPRPGTLPPGTRP